MSPITMPAAIEAEQCVLASMFLGGTLPPGTLSRGDFYRPAHGEIFDAIESMTARGVPVDIVTLSGEMQRRGTLEAVGGTAYLMSIGDFLPSAANVAHYAQSVRDASTLRRVIETSHELIQLAGRDDAEASAVVEAAERRMLALSQTKQRETLFSVQQVLRNGYDALEARARSGGRITGLSTGLPSLDAMTCGLQRGDMSILAARPSVGKTALAVNILTHVAQSGGRALFFSLEMSHDQVYQRMVSSVGGVSGDAVRSGMLTPGEHLRCKQAHAALWDTRYTIDDERSVTASYIRSTARRAAAQFGGLDLVVIDYLQLIEGEATRGENSNRNQQISVISRSLKVMAGELDCHVLALSQLSRNLEHREDKRPLLSDLRESGAIEQDADLVMGLYRASRYGSSHVPGDVRDPSELLIRKQRMGPVGTIHIEYVGEFSRFSEPVEGGF